MYLKFYFFSNMFSLDKLIKLKYKFELSNNINYKLKICLNNGLKFNLIFL